MAGKKSETKTDAEAEGSRELVDQTAGVSAELPTVIRSLMPGTRVGAFELEAMHSIAWLIPSIGVPCYLKMASFPFTVDEEIMARGGKKQRQPATACKVVDLETGELRQIIMGVVIYNELERNYPELSWVGKSFMFIRGEERTAGDGKTKYNPYIIGRIKTPAYAADFMDDSIPNPKAKPATSA